MGGVEWELGPGFVAGGEDLDRQRRARHVQRVGSGREQATVRYAVVVGLADVELRHGFQPRGASERLQQHGDLGLQAGMSAKRGGSHVQYTIPHLVAPVLPEPPPALQQRLEVGGRRIHNQRGHGGSVARISV